MPAASFASACVEVKIVTRLTYRTSTKLEYTAAPCHTGQHSNSSEFHPLLHTGEPPHATACGFCTEHLSGHLQGSKTKEGSCTQHFCSTGSCAALSTHSDLPSAIPTCSTAPSPHLNRGAKPMLPSLSKRFLSNVFKDMPWHVLKIHHLLGE